MEPKKHLAIFATKNLTPNVCLLQTLYLNLMGGMPLLILMDYNHLKKSRQSLFNSTPASPFIT